MLAAFCPIWLYFSLCFFQRRRFFPLNRRHPLLVSLLNFVLIPLLIGLWGPYESSMCGAWIMIYVPVAPPVVLVMAGRAFALLTQLEVEQDLLLQARLHQATVKQHQEQLTSSASAGGSAAPTARVRPAASSAPVQHWEPNWFTRHLHLTRTSTLLWASLGYWLFFQLAMGVIALRTMRADNFFVRCGLESTAPYEWAGTVLQLIGCAGPAAALAVLAVKLHRLGTDGFGIKTEFKRISVVSLQSGAASRKGLPCVLCARAQLVSVVVLAVLVEFAMGNSRNVHVGFLFTLRECLCHGA